MIAAMETLEKFQYSNDYSLLQTKGKTSQINLN